MGYVTVTPETVEPIDVPTLVDMVKTRMDEIDHASISIDVGVVDNRPLESIIESLLNECKLEVLTNAPISQLPKVKYSFASNKHSALSGYDTAAIEVPDDALRVLSIRNSDWKRTLTTFVETTSSKYARQAYEFVKATNSNPAAAMIDGTSVEIFPYKSPATTEMIYVSSDTSYAQLNRRMIDALCWLCAVKTFTVMGLPEIAQRCAEFYKMIIT